MTSYYLNVLHYEINTCPLAKTYVIKQNAVQKFMNMMTQEENIRILVVVKRECVFDLL